MSADANGNANHERNGSGRKRISVIIPVYNGVDTLQACLDALSNQITDVHEYEVIVVDDGSTDGTPELVRSWLASTNVEGRLIQQANAGPAVARNHGARDAEAPLLLFTDADCVPDADWIEKLSAPFANDVDGAKGVYRSDQNNIVARFVQAEYEDRYDRMRNADRIDFIDTYSAAYRRDVFLANGGFDAIFPSASVEDQEFSFRLAQRGYMLKFVPDAVVAHTHDESVRQYARRKYFIGYWKALVMRRFPQRVVQDSHTPQVLKLQLVLAAIMVTLAPFSSLSKRFPAFRLVRKLMLACGTVFLASAFPFLLKLARKSPKLALAGVGLIFVRAIALGLGYFVGMVRFSGSVPPIETVREN